MDKFTRFMETQAGVLLLFMFCFLLMTCGAIVVAVAFPMQKELVLPLVLAGNGFSSSMLAVAVVIRGRVTGEKPTEGDKQ